ncbi:MAG: YraN family protein [Chloroflexi bacterium]|nr:YraN family protein [Chloroflexota bacterium]
MNRKALGALGEKRAAEFLKKKGHRILETNFRCREGELDIISRDRDCLVFVEVRTRSSADFGTPEESITRAKKEKLVSVALAYLQTHRNPPECWRFDVVAVEVGPEGRTTRIEVIENALG